MAINFRNINFKYIKKSSNKILDNINLHIKSTDEFITILGHTGSGKTTLVQHMNALLLPSDGELTIFDKRITNSKKLKLKSIRSQIGLVFQFPEYQLFEENILKDVMFGPKNFGKSKEEAEQLAIKAIELVGLSKDLLDRSPFSLSGGQMRRVAIAGILAINPDILILDEPTVGLDPKGKQELITLLKDIHEITHKTIIMITHDMNVVAQVAKRVVVLQNGKIVYDGNRQNLFTDEQKLFDFNLDLPRSAYLAKKLTQVGILKYEELPLTADDLIKAIERMGDKNE